MNFMNAIASGLIRTLTELSYNIFSLLGSILTIFIYIWIITWILKKIFK